jgi:hypothetical protein
MASSGQLDVGKLASDLGVGGGRSLDLGQVAQTLTSGGSGANQIVGALSQQGGSLTRLLGSAANALKPPAGMAVGGAALAAGAVGAGLLWKRSQGGGGGSGGSGGSGSSGGGGGITGALGSLFGGGGLGAMFGGSDQSSADAAQFSQIAAQLPPPHPSQLKEGTKVLARWDAQEWRAGQITWVDGGQARVTFDSGLEKWCAPEEIRVPPQPGGQSVQPPQESGPTSTPSDDPFAKRDDPFADMDDDPFK